MTFNRSILSKTTTNLSNYSKWSIVLTILTILVFLAHFNFATFSTTPLSTQLRPQSSTMMSTQDTGCPTLTVVGSIVSDDEIKLTISGGEGLDEMLVDDIRISSYEGEDSYPFEGSFNLAEINDSELTVPAGLGNLSSDRDYKVEISFTFAEVQCTISSAPFPQSPCSRLELISALPNSITNYALLLGDGIEMEFSSGVYTVGFGQAKVSLVPDEGPTEPYELNFIQPNESAKVIVSKATSVIPAGTYTISITDLKVGTEKCNVNSITSQITVDNQCPVIEFDPNNPNPVPTGEKITIKFKNAIPPFLVSEANRNNSFIEITSNCDKNTYSGYIWTPSTDFKSLTATTSQNYELPGKYTVKFGYWPSCEELTGSFKITSTVMSGQILEQESKSIKLSWKSPYARLDRYETDSTLPTLHYQFNLYKNPGSGSFPPQNDHLATLVAHKISFPACGAREAVEWNDIAATLIPETAESAVFTLPNMPVGTGDDKYVIVMVPIGFGQRYGHQTQQSISVMFGPIGLPSSCPDACTSPLECNEYTGKCELMSSYTTTEHAPWTISPLIDNTTDDNECTLECPIYFEQSSTCLQCECITEECIRNTRSTQVRLNSIDKNIEKLYEDVDYIKRSTSIVQHLNSTLSRMLMLNQLPLDSNYYRPATSDPDALSALLLLYTSTVEDNAPVGCEKLFISFMNPTTKIQYLDTLIITIVIIPTNADDPLESRFEELFNRLNYLINKVSSQTRPTFTKNSYQTLPYSFTFTPSVPKPFKNNLFGANANRKTVCKSHTNDNDITQCPPPLSTLLSKSSFWSHCSDEATTQSILTQCHDYNNEPNSPTTARWCRQGYPGYPSLPTITCPDLTQPQTYPESITWAPTPQVTLPITTPIELRSAEGLTIAWNWQDEFSSSATIDIIFTPSTGYSTILSTVLATQRGITVSMPRLHQSTTGVIRCRVTQQVRVKTTDPIPVNIAALDLCNGIDAPQCGTNEQCQPLTGRCACVSGAKRNIHANDECQFPCHGLCKSETDCTAEKPTQCTNCPTGLMGPLCQTPSGCGNVGDSNVECSLNGFITMNGENQCSGTCKCNNSWGGEKCNVCDLVQGQNIPIESQCVAKHTDIGLTKSTDTVNGGANCSRCVCLGGYFGDLCQYTAIRADVVFQFNNDDEVDETVPFITSSTSTTTATPATTSTTVPLNALHKLTTNAITKQMIGSIRSISKAQPLPSSASSFVTAMMKNAQYVEGYEGDNGSGFNIEPHGAEYITPEGRQVLVNDISLSLGLRPDLITIFNITQFTQVDEPLIEPFSATNTNTTTVTIVSYSITGGNSGISLEDLASTWGSLQGDFGSVPIVDSEAGREIGGLDSLTDALLPIVKIEQCTQEEMDANNGVCPSNSTAIIIGVAVGVVCVLVLFIVTIILVKYAKKNQKWCFKPEDEKRNDGLELTASDTSVATQTTNLSTQTSAKSNVSAISGSATAIDLVEIKDHGEDLPPGWTKQQHSTTGDVFYVNQREMISQRHPPGQNAGNGW